MLRYIYRQRRRLVMISCLVMGAALMSDTGLSADLFATSPVSASAATLIMIVVIMLALAPVLFLFPALRFAFDIMAILSFVLTALHATWPNWASPGFAPWLAPYLPIVVIFAISFTIYGDVLDRFALWVDWRSRRSYRSQKSEQELWLELIPGKAPVERHWDKLLQEIRRDPEDPSHLELTYTHGHGLFEHSDMTILADDPYRHFKYRFQARIAGPKAPFARGTREIWIAPQPGGGCRVTIEQTRAALSLREGLMRWLDDSLGDETDHLRGRGDRSLTRRYRKKALRWA